MKKLKRTECLKASVHLKTEGASIAPCFCSAIEKQEEHASPIIPTMLAQALPTPSTSILRFGQVTKFVFTWRKVRHLLLHVSTKSHLNA
ncbi:hypothetical protein X798_01483 [Onchocerca flexuosa]|uniref:Uncharacterized protein n=1 Tax=Onchocerca flexuosa TaxID=387005 RepID=A0A238C3I2_9BILA|nr:hypothetical protein X798_01483 [Onchocerca flexuosa]